MAAMQTRESSVFESAIAEANIEEYVKGIEDGTRSRAILDETHGSKDLKLSTQIVSVTCEDPINFDPSNFELARMLGGLAGLAKPLQKEGAK